MYQTRTQQTYFELKVNILKTFSIFTFPFVYLLFIYFFLAFIQQSIGTFFESLLRCSYLKRFSFERKKKKVFFFFNLILT